MLVTFEVYPLRERLVANVGAARDIAWEINAISVVVAIALRMLRALVFVIGMLSALVLAQVALLLEPLAIS